MVSKKIDKGKQEEIVKTGRERWKIENEGFNVQKHHGYFIEHVFSRNYNAMKNHYLLAQIAHMIRQLMEKGLKSYNRYKKKLKDISRKLLELFRTRILTQEEVKDAKERCQIRFYRENTS